MHTVLFLLAFLVALVIYFIPAMVAGARGHYNATAIFVANLLLGWTLIGWAGSMVWAFTNLPPSAGTAAAATHSTSATVFKVILAVVAGLFILFGVMSLMPHSAGDHAMAPATSSAPAASSGVPTPADEILGK